MPGELQREVRVVLVAGDVCTRGDVFRIEAGVATAVARDVQARKARPSDVLLLAPGRYSYGFSVYGGSGKFTIKAVYEGGPDLRVLEDDAAHVDDHGLDFEIPGSTP